MDDVHKAVSIAQAGIKGTLESLKKTPSQATKRTVRTRTPKKKVPAGGKTQPKPKREHKRRARNPSKLVIESRAVVPRKSTKQKPAMKSK
ncbi:MAG: hypothetical protein EHM80_12110 [Nitrospiraceae bacterium]|nr:MAG: hypothetical protein EHM80_12110 [Nitrospiraceae bacterium]